MERTHANDNDELSFISLAAATANVMRYLEQKKLGDHPADQAEGDAPKKEVPEPEQKSSYIDAGLKRIQRFERRYRSSQDRS